MIAGGLSLSGSAWTQADEEAEAPRLKPPAFPLEPGKVKEGPIAPDSYVEAPESPFNSGAPGEDEADISRLERSETQWGLDWDLGWFYANQTAKHEFRGALVAPMTVRRANASPLSISSVAHLRPPGTRVSVLAWVGGSTGRADLSTSDTSIALTRINVQDIRGGLGARYRIGSGAIRPLVYQRHEWAVGADVEGVVASTTTLTAAQTDVDVDSRSILWLIVRADYRYSPRGNWGVELRAGYGWGLSGAGEGDTAGRVLRRWDAEARGLRYLSHGHAIGVGATYSYERAQWDRTQPSVLVDTVELTDLRLALFWRQEF